jgi:PPM family protein phosphatase
MNGTEEDKPQASAGETQAPDPTTQVEGDAGGEVVAVSAALPSIAGDGVRTRYTGRTAVGLVREHNEDNLVIVDLTAGEVRPRDEVVSGKVGEAGVMFAVCDGMGGAAAGEIASQMAVDILNESMRRAGTPKDRDDLARALVSSVEEAGRRIFETAQKERTKRGMGTTATVAVLVDKILFLAEVGDSRAYLLRKGVLKQLTKDQSLVNQLIEAGHLTEAEAEAFEHSNIILQALGTSESVQVDLTFAELRKGDRLMMCSDGLSGLVHSDTLREALAEIEDPAECTKTLIKYAEAGGGHDNITVIIADFDGDALDAPGDSDTFGYMQYPLMPKEGGKDVFGDEEVTDSGAASASPSVRARRTPLPPADGTDSDDSGSWMWLAAGVCVLVLGAWVLATSSAAPPDVTLEGSQESSAPRPKSAATETAEVKPVPVKVWSDVEGATLLVNGEPHGALVAGRSTDVSLRPGAYRFEAQSNGNIAAVEVATVRPDVPLDVRLRLPSAAQEGEPGTPVEPGEPGVATEVVEAKKDEPNPPPSAAVEEAPEVPAAEPKAPTPEAQSAAPEKPKAEAVAPSAPAAPAPEGQGATP